MSGDQDDRQELILLVGRIDANVQTLLEKASGHERRIRSLEADRWKIFGVLIGLGAFLSKNYLSPLMGLFTAGVGG